MDLAYTCFLSWKLTVISSICSLSSFWRDQRLHKLVFEEDGLPDGTEVAYYSRGQVCLLRRYSSALKTLANLKSMIFCEQKLLEGYKKGFGIFCRCCNCEVLVSSFELQLLEQLKNVHMLANFKMQVSPSQFEVHAGWASRKKPWVFSFFLLPLTFSFAREANWLICSVLIWQLFEYLHIQWGVSPWIGNLSIERA